MIKIRKSDERGRGDHGWLQSRHTFSFADYFDPEHNGFRSLRVINDDRVAAGKGFPTHSHRDMEIISWVLEGRLQHRDSMGHEAVLAPGELQHISAGTGITHSEFNASQAEPVHFLQVWIVPSRTGLPPQYSQVAVPVADRHNQFRMLAAPEVNKCIQINQDARIYVANLDSGVTVWHSLAAGRSAWIHVARGSLSLNDDPLAEGDGAAVTDEEHLEIRGIGACEILLFDLA